MTLHELQRRYESYLSLAEAMEAPVLKMGYFREAMALRARIEPLLDPAVSRFDELVAEYIEVEKKLAQLL